MHCDEYEEAVNTTGLPLAFGKGGLLSRRRKDLKKLVQEGFETQQAQDSTDQLGVILKGPEVSLYQEGRWLVQVYIPDQYPLKPPSLGFATKIFHPNIDSR